MEEAKHREDVEIHVGHIWLNGDKIGAGYWRNGEGVPFIELSHIFKGNESCFELDLLAATAIINVLAGTMAMAMDPTIENGAE